MKRTTTERALDYQLVTRAQERLFANGTEAHRLRTLLLVALADAAELAGDKAEASDLRVQLSELVRATTNPAPPTRE